ncbi:hypothetical protein ASZ90_004337 [hydrocarbon metagenome]|uniref:Uncharacterized protein n=1 Tax=hydrocarbon metagenome TaxID=938273 RepID=A0A0W8FY85_9ZZZZ
MSLAETLDNNISLTWVDFSSNNARIKVEPENIITTIRRNRNAKLDIKNR